MSIPRVVTLDFETEGIEARPIYPPVPVGCAVHISGKSKYLSWGHPTENNCTKTQATKELKTILRNNDVLFHNAGFDIDVGVAHMGWGSWAKSRGWKHFHDTLFLAFLNDPRDTTLSLKPWCDKYLGMAPVEQDKLKEWILNNVEGAHDHKSSKKHPELYWAANICLAPGRLAGRYAKGDVLRTHKMFRYLWPIVIDKYRMGEAYNRERQGLRIFTDMSKVGLRVNRTQLGRDIATFQDKQKRIEKQIYNKLCVKEINLGSGVQLAKALDAAGLVDGWEYTEKGNKSTKRDNLNKHITDKRLMTLLAQHGVLDTYLNTFMEPWYEKSKSTGRIFPSFNQVRSTGEFVGGSAGTRTGRPSSNNPNLLNVPRNLDDKEAWHKHMPWMRNYIMPDKGCVLLNRDYSQQEVRILAHYEEGNLASAFIKDPKADAHNKAREMIKTSTGVDYPRKFIKETFFGIIYGMGIQALADRLGITYDEARILKNLFLKVFPGIRKVINEIKQILTDGGFVSTWGGRIYYEEEHPLRDLKYKMINYVIQGGAADITKQGMINVVDNCRDSRLSLQVYDEIMLNTPIGRKKIEMMRMEEAMAEIELDVPMRSDGKMSSKSWGSLTNYM